MVRLKMAESVKQAVGFVEEGNVRVGPNAVTDPAFLVTREPLRRPVCIGPC